MKDLSKRLERANLRLEKLLRRLEKENSKSETQTFIEECKEMNLTAREKLNEEKNKSIMKKLMLSQLAWISRFEREQRRFVFR